MRIGITILIIQFLCFKTCLTQSVKVDVSFFDNYSPNGASVQILDSVSQELIDFCIVGDNGICFFEDLKNNTYQINARYFGYQDTTHYFSLKKNQTLEFKFVLRSFNYNLPDISIVDKVIGLKKKGDTIVYNVNAYRSGTEQSLGDLLNTLPGVEVNLDGNVMVRNKKVDAFLVEGRELINSQHKLATEGLQYDIVKNIELIENYKSEKEIFENSEQETTKVAINVRLKEEAKEVWKGNLELFIGNSNKLSSAVNLFKVSQKMGWSIFLRQNNVGEDPVEKPTSILLDDLLAQSSSVNDLRVGQLDYSQDDNSNANIEKGVINNNDYHFSINGDLIINKKIKNKTYITGSLVNRTVEKNIKRDYFNNAIVENRTDNSNFSYPFLYVRNKLALQWNKSNYTEFYLPFYLLSKEQQINEKGDFNNNDFFQIVDSKKQSISFAPRIEHILKLKNDFTITSKHEYNIENNNNRININSDDPFLDLSNIPESEGYRFSQDLNRDDTKYSTQLLLKKRWKRNYIQWLVQYKDGNEKIEIINSDSQNSLVSRELQLSNKLIQHGLKGVKVYKKGRILLSLSQAYLKQDLNSTGNLSSNYILPYALFYHEYYKQHAFSILISKDIQYSRLNEYNDFPLVLSARSTLIGGLGIESIQSSQNIKLSFFKIPRASGFRYKLEFFYSKINNSFISNSTDRSFYIQDNYLLVPQVGRYLVNAWGSHFFEKWSINFSHFSSYSENYTSRLEQLLSLNSLQSSTVFNLRSKSWKNWEVNIGFGHNYILQRQNDTKVTFSSYDISSKVKYTFNSWDLALFLTKKLQSNREVINNNLTILDINLAYRLNNDWRISLKLINILNMQSTQLVDYDYNTRYNQITTYQTFPGQIMLGAGYFF